MRVLYVCMCKREIERERECERERVCERERERKEEREKERHLEIYGSPEVEAKTLVQTVQG